MRAKLVQRARDWKWSSARAHLSGKDDGFVAVAPLLALVADWEEFLSAGLGEEPLAAIRKSERTGRPLGATPFLRRLETRLGRVLTRQKPGPKAQHHLSR